MTTVCRRASRNDSVDLSDSSPARRSPNAGAESDYDSARSESDLSEREGENGDAQRKIDHDEDRSNPQYIPKRGTFYEHDDRTAASGDEGGETEKKESPDTTQTSESGDRKGKPRRAQADKWRHDKYNEDQQTPKSREELIATYGYDIRNEEAPPHARRNKKYTRGPNKYTRTWEDEEAYRRRASVAQKKQQPPRPQDFPQLPPTGDAARENKPQQPRSPRAPDQSPTTPRQDRRNGAPPKQRDDKKINITVGNATSNGSPPERKVSSEKPSPRPAPPRSEPIRKEQPTNERERMAPQVPKPSQQKIEATHPQPQVTQNKPPEQPQQNSQPPGDNRPGSKRYSSTRQRPLVDGAVPSQALPRVHNIVPQTAQTLPQPPMQQRYVQEMPQATPIHTQQQLPHQQVQQVHRATSAQPLQQHPQQMQQQLQQHQPQQLPQQLLQQQLVSHQHALHNMSAQQHMTGQMPPQQSYTSQALMQAQYLQGPNNAVFGGAPVYAAPPPAPYPHQLYQHHNYSHQAGIGVTYYGGVEQEQTSARQRRPTAAIPIVSPPTNKSGSAADKDNIDHIVDNMFTRRQRPAAHAPPSGKEKSDTSPSPSLTSSTTSNESRPSAERQDSRDEAPPTPAPAPAPTEREEEEGKAEVVATPTEEKPVEAVKVTTEA